VTSGRSTVYFNKMWQTSDSRADWLQSKHIYLNEDRIATKYNSEGNNNTEAEKTRVYFYHSDHLGSAQVVTNSEGKIHERLEYTPYGELWIDWKSETALEDKTPFRFTGKEMDAETGFYYYGARYMDPKTSRWISTDPAMGEYIPSAPVNDEAKKRNGNLPGQGGVFNYVNLHVYHYAGNNPVKYVDPDGEFSEAYIQTRRRKELNDGRNHRLEVAQNIARNATMYKQGGGGRGHLLGPDLTYCNQATFDVAEAVGFNTNALYNGKDRGYVNADTAAKNLMKAASNNLVTEVKGEDAQLLANRGYLVIAAMESPRSGVSGHLATVRPSDAVYNSAEGPSISNVGPLGRNKIVSTKEAFALEKYEDNGKVKFYFDFKQTF